VLGPPVGGFPERKPRGLIAFGSQRCTTAGDREMLLKRDDTHDCSPNALQLIPIRYHPALDRRRQAFVSASAGSAQGHSRWVWRYPSHFRFSPTSRRSSKGSTCPKGARNGLLHRGYSITSSARTSIGGGIVRPSAFAVFRLITSSTFVDNWTGRSAGFSPLRMRPV
jgi:hypothetical protein